MIPIYLWMGELLSVGISFAGIPNITNEVSDLVGRIETNDFK